MKALAITPLHADSLRLIEVETPSIEAVPEGRGVLVEVLKVGICGTDRELHRGDFGRAPEGWDRLIIGHESLGRVVETGAAVTNLKPGDLVTATVRRPGDSDLDRMLMQDMSPNTRHIERGITDMHGFMAEYFVDDATFLVPVAETLAAVGVLAEPMSVVEKGIRQAFLIQRRLPDWDPGRTAVVGAGPIGLLAALAMRLKGLDVTVFSRREAPYPNSELLADAGIAYQSTGGGSLAEANAGQPAFGLIFEASGSSARGFDAVSMLANNGVVVLSSVTAGSSQLTIDADLFNMSMVFGNKLIVGTVNAAYEDFEQGLRDMALSEQLFPGWLNRMLDVRIDGLEDVEQVRHHLLSGHGAIKAYIDVAQ